MSKTTITVQESTLERFKNAKQTVEQQEEWPSLSGDDFLQTLLKAWRREDRSTPIQCGCGEFYVLARKEPMSVDIVCPECLNHFGHGAPADEPCPCKHNHDEMKFDVDTIRDALDTDAPTYDDVKAACKDAIEEVQER